MHRIRERERELSQERCAVCRLFSRAQGVVLFEKEEIRNICLKILTAKEYKEKNKKETKLTSL